MLLERWWLVLPVWKQFSNRVKCPSGFESVLIAKSKRIASIVKYMSALALCSFILIHDLITFASPNEEKLIAMENALFSQNLFCPIERNNCSMDALFQMLKPIIWLLLEKGVKILVSTIGSNGVLLCTKRESIS
ncbi:putative sugar kinase YeiI isoform X2 [Gossypium australe]|uniref:Putative sugar kinase YeiI isoform X2 n=1 Tax=Gossypium australe TaxID=47621 RepID=A0A5B6V1S5_9ROSI|nr:putative sugar kinase YeiI isoform X2 [Gossypium australe]KAA3462992.1 putative sugar kinase YeiI isoform X2 [Gossypium australe]